MKSLNDLHAVIAFFEERRGRLHGFRWRDPSDFKSCPPRARPPRSTSRSAPATAHRSFQLAKTYGANFNPWTRDITKPVAGTVLVAVAEVVQTPDRLHRRPRHRHRHLSHRPHPRSRRVITAGFEFDVPVRFDTDKLEIDLQGFRHGAIPSIPIVEIRV